jgi:hypothetical protein
MRKLQMKSTLLAIVAAAAVTFGAAGAAQALLVAGWDHSQYFGDALLSTDGATFTDTLPANYSSLVAGGLGNAAGAYGTLYLNGQFGSTNVGAGSGTEPFLPSAAVGGSLASNLSAPVVDGFLNPFDSFTELTLGGQAFMNSLAMTALGAASVVYAADAGLPGTDWILTFGARTQAGASSIAIEFSEDGASYAPVGVANLTTVDTAYSFNLSALQVDRGFVRIVFDSPATAPVIDNVAISATVIPEPGTALLLLAGLGGLAAHGRRRA